MAGTAEDFTFLDEPIFKKLEGKITCAVRVRCHGIDWAVQLELVDAAWTVVSDQAVLDACPSVIEVVTKYARSAVH